MSKRKAIITGVSSFVGCHLARAFADDYDVVAVTSRARDTYDGVRGERLAYIADAVTFAVCDLTDPQALAALIDAHAPDVWVQHAGYAENYASLDFDLEKSLALNVVALEPLYKKLADIDCTVIVTGSNAEYASSDLANRESDACWPELPYGVSKLAETVEASRLAHQYKVPTRVARLYIPVGAYDAPGKLMDFVIKKLAAGEVADLSPCEQQRDFLGVGDVARAYVLMAGDMAGDTYRRMFDIFNICSGQATELRSLLLKVAKLMDADESLLNFAAKPMRPGEPMTSFGDNAKARDVLGWQPLNIENALSALIAQVRENS